MSLRNTNDLQKNQPLSGPTVDFQGGGMGGTSRGVNMFKNGSSTMTIISNYDVTTQQDFRF